MAESLFYAVFVGVGLGLIFDFFRLPRLALGDKFFFDFLFWIISALVTFCYLLIFNDGIVRSINLLCIAFGFVVTVFTLGTVTKPIQLKLAKKIKKRLKYFKKQLQKLHNIYYNIISKLKVLKGGKNGKGSRKKREEL